MRHGPTPHGTYNGYTNYRCRCDDCRAANNAFERERKRRRKLKPDALVAELNAGVIGGRVRDWQAVYRAGAAGAVCDEIVANRPVPVALLAALAGEEGA